MILEAVFNLFITALEAIFSWINLPQMPESITSMVDTFESLMFDNLSCLSFFVRISTVKILLPLLLVVVNFDRVWSFTMFILRKIPFLGIE